MPVGEVGEEGKGMAGVGEAAPQRESTHWVLCVEVLASSPQMKILGGF